MVLAISAVGAGVAMAAGGSGTSATVSVDGTVIEGQVIRGYLDVKANNVTIRNSTFRSGGRYVLRVLAGYSGTVIEDTKIYCTGDQTNGVVSGNYTARRVEVFGCRAGFIYGDSAPAMIVASAWNGKEVSAGTGLGSAPAPPERRTAAPAEAGKSASAGSAPESSAVAGAYPGPDNTGVPAGTKLRPSGSLLLSRDGQVVSGLNITGCVTVIARNVVIQRSRITCGAQYSIKTTGARAKNLLVQDVEIDGKGTNAAAVCCSDYTLRRLEIKNVLDGPRLSDNTTVEQSWIHHLTRVGGSHNDALQTTGASNIVIRGNTLEAYNPVISDPLNACLMLGSTTGPIVSNLVFEGNYCNGGNYSIGVRTDLRASNIRIQDNAFGHDYRFGVVARPAHPGIVWHKPTNVWLDSRKPVVR